MNLNNLTTKQLNNKIDTRRKEASKADMDILHIIESVSYGSDDIRLKAIHELVRQHNERSYENAMILDEIIEIRDTQVWMENRATNIKEST